MTGEQAFKRCTVETMRGFSRRQFCAAGALGGLSLGLYGCEGDKVGFAPPAGQPEGTFAIPPAAAGSAEMALTLARFRGALGQSFEVAGEDGSSRRLTLARIVDHGAPIRRPIARGEAFTLLFEERSPLAGAAGLAAMTYQARHATLGAFSLFLVPSGRAAGAYDATFNRI
jgi:hypothetical protein